LAVLKKKCEFADQHLHDPTSDTDKRLTVVNDAWFQMTLTFHLGSACQVRLMAMLDIHPFPAFLDLAAPLAE
jgi:hypothetical protein